MIALHHGQSSSPLVDYCRRYAHYHDVKAGQDAIQFLKTSQSGDLGDAAVECLQLILQEKPTKLDASQDTIIAELSRASRLVRKSFVDNLVDKTTEFFEDIYERGDEAANCLRLIVLEPKLWQDEHTRLRVENDLFVLFFAKLLESGHDHDGRALRGITLLLLSDTQRLYHHIDEDAFDALLTSLDLRLPPDVRGQATLVITKFMEMSELEAQKYFLTFVTSKMTRQKAEDLIQAFSAAAQLFPVASNLAAQLFLTKGFLSGIVPILHQRLSTTLVYDSFLALVSAACVDGACRKAIQEHCTTWLSHVVSNGTGRQPHAAATVLAKLRTSAMDQKADQADNDVSDLVGLFQKSLVVHQGNLSDSIEGLAYTSLKPEVKEQVATDAKLIRAILQALEEHPSSPEIIVGGLSILANLTHYQPNLSDEQKKMTQLKAYANASKQADVSPLEDDTHVQARCTTLVKAGATSTLVKINKQPSAATAQLTDKIFLSLSRNPKDRGILAQQGAVKLLIDHSGRAKIEDAPTMPLSQPREGTPKMSTSQDAAHALARILISLNPSHVFPASTTPHITSAIPPLTDLIKPPPTSGPALSDQPRDLLPIFESLLALTNLASSQDTSVCRSIINSSWESIEDLILSSNELVRRAAVELICNLVAYPEGVAKFADGSRQAQERLRIMVAMADVEDAKTRSAAGGALAMLTEYTVISETLINDTKFARTIEIVVDMVGDEDLGLKHRGLVILLNLLEAEGQAGVKSRTEIAATGGTEQVKEVLKQVRDQGVLQIGVEVLKKLVC